MSPRPRIPSARFISDRNASDRRYNRPNTAATATSNKTRSQRTVLALSPAVAPRKVVARARSSVHVIPPPGQKPCGARSPWSGNLLGLGSRVPLRDVAKRVARQLYRGCVHHLPVHAYRARACDVGLLVGGDDLLRPIHFPSGGREALVDYLYLGGVDAPLAVEAQRAGDQAAPA